MDVHTENLQSLLLLEDALDKEVERKETELKWDRRKLVYLQALGCPTTDINDLDLTIRRSEGVLGIMKQLLQQTFQDRVVCANQVQTMVEARSNSPIPRPGSGSFDRKGRHNHHTKLRLKNSRKRSLRRQPFPGNLWCATSKLGSTLEVGSGSGSEAPSVPARSCNCSPPRSLETYASMEGETTPECIDTMRVSCGTSKGNLTRPSYVGKSALGGEASVSISPPYRPLPGWSTSEREVYPGCAPKKAPRRIWSLTENGHSTAEQKKLQVCTNISSNHRDGYCMGDSLCQNTQNTSHQETIHPIDRNWFTHSLAYSREAQSPVSVTPDAELIRRPRDITGSLDHQSDCYWSDLLCAVNVREG